MTGPQWVACWGCADGRAVVRCARTAHTLCPECADRYCPDESDRLPLDRGAEGMDWQSLLAQLDRVEGVIAESDSRGHDPDGAIDPETGGAYCLGCEVGSAAQRLRIAVRDYTQSTA